MVLQYGSMKLQVMIVTPAAAKKWLERNVSNRRLRAAVAATYAADMVAGKWERKPVAICFTEDGKLANGQHTLTAIVDSGVSQELLVATEVPAKSVAFMDLGLRRTIGDVAKFFDTELTSARGAVARVIRAGPRDAARSLSFSELLEIYQEHQQAIEFVMPKASHKAGVNSISLAICARASYTQDNQRILEFLDVVATGNIESKADTAALKFRDFAQSLRSASTQETRVETYRKCQNALEHFLLRSPITKLYGNDNVFPIPGAA